MRVYIHSTAWLLFGISHAIPLDTFDEWNFNGQKLAAVGDSYSAGIGAGGAFARLGTPLDVHNVANHYTDWWCSRYSHSYPYLLNRGIGDLNERGGKFQFLSCSGAKTKEIIDTQVPRLDDGQNAILISSGASDFGFADIINQCVHQLFSPSKLLTTLAEHADLRSELKKRMGEQMERPGVKVPDFDLSKFARTCEEQLAESKKVIEDAKFSNGIADLIKKAKGKLASDGLIFYTSYAKFWSTTAQEGDWCDNPENSWSMLIPNTKHVNNFQKPVRLAHENRVKMNELIDLVNQKIMDEVVKAGENVHFVNWDKASANMGGQFCRHEVQEPHIDRWDVGFHQVDSNAPWSNQSVAEIVPGSFEGQLNGMAGAAFDMGATYKGCNTNNENAGIKKRAVFIPDTIANMFHPTSRPHLLISEFITRSWASARLASHQKRQGAIGKRGLGSLIEPRVDAAACAYVPKTSSAPSSSPPPPPTKKTCWKDNAERMKDHKNWKFVEPDELSKAIVQFCESDWSGNGGNELEEWNKTHTYFKDNDDWNTVNIIVGGPAKTGAVKEYCRKNLEAISAGCDNDKNTNQFNFKWGGEWVDESGVKWTIEPVHERVAFSAESAGEKNKGKLNKKFTQLDDTGKMTLQMCIHRLRIKENGDDTNCGGLAKVTIKRTLYNDFQNCVAKTWRYLSNGIEKGEAWEAAHNPGVAKCKAEVEI